MVDSIEKEIRLKKELLNGEEITSIYFGGGTPSMLTRSQLEVIINSIASSSNVSSNAEVESFSIDGPLCTSH